MKRTDIGYPVEVIIMAAARVAAKFIKWITCGSYTIRVDGDIL